MRVTGLELYAANLEEAISFSLFGSDRRADYEVRSILGLDPGDIVPKFYANNIAGDEKYYNFVLQPRDIVLRVILKPRYELDESYSSARDRLYRAISANRSGLVTLQFKSGGTTVAGITGSVRRFEAVHFTALPEVQLTIRCKDPMFKSVNPTLFEAADLPSANPVLLPDSLSTAPHGFSMEVVFTEAAASFTIQDVETDPEWKFKVTPSGGFLTGDTLYISSDYSNRSVHTVRSGITTHLLDKVEASSVWPIIFPGQNSFHFVNIASIDWNYVTYDAAYWGV